MIVNRLYDGIRKNKLLTVGLVGYGLGIGSMCHAYSNIRNPKSENMARAERITQELEGTVPQEIRLKEILNPAVINPLLDHVQKIKAEKDSLEHLPSFPKERLDYEMREEKRKDSLYEIVVGSLIGMSSSFPVGIGLGNRRRRKEIERLERLN